MKTSIKTNNPPTPDITYPCFMQCIPGRYSVTQPDAELVVLFTAECTGFVVHSVNMNSCEIGHHSDCWIAADDELAWKPFRGTITVE